jgi:hypothetical protein
VVGDDAVLAARGGGIRIGIVPAMWRTLMDGLPDFTQGTFEVRDVLNLLMTTLAAWLAFLAIRMGREQGVIAEKQAAIAEKQDRVLQAQLARTSSLRMSTRYQTRDFGSGTGSGPTFVVCDVVNGGSKTTDGFYWAIFIPRSLENLVRFVDANGSPILVRPTPLPEFYFPIKLDGHYEKRLFPLSNAIVARLSITDDETTQEFNVQWRLVGDDGPVPTGGQVAVINFTRLVDGLYHVMDLPPETQQGGPTSPRLE